MAFREDSDALHARIDALEKELEDARGELERLREIEKERDRLKRELEGLRPKKKERERPPPPTLEPPSATASWRPQKPWSAQAWVLAGLVAILGFGILAWIFADCSGSVTAGPKPPDTRAPSIGVVDLSATPDPAPIPFVVTGTDEAPPDCRGYLPDAPQLVLRASSPTLTTITTRCGVDLVAVLSGAPAGLLCDDDSGGSVQPLIQTVLGPGDARLTIGTYSQGAQASCEIVIHAAPLPASVDANGLAGAASPRLGTVSLGAAPGVETSYDGTISGALIDVSRVQTGCVGVVGSTPDVVLEISEPTVARLDASSASDLVLVMQAPDGSFTCDDDDGMGNAPRIAKRLAPGRYAVWVGAFSSSGASASFQVGVHLATIASEERAAPSTVELEIGTPVAVTGTTGDELAAPSMWSDCTLAGYVRYEPDSIFHLAARRDVTISASAGGSAPLLVVAPHGRAAAGAMHVVCTQDGAWRGTLDVGDYDLFVGIASGDVEPSAFRATISAAPPSVLPYSP